MLVAGVVAVVPAFLQDVAWSAAAYGVDDQSPEVVRGLYDLGNVGFTLAAYPLALMVVAASLGAHRAGILSTASTRVGVVLGALIALSAIPEGAIMVGFVVFVSWSLVVSWILLGRSAAPTGP